MFNLGQLLKVVDPDPVLVDQRACLWLRHRGSPCRACAEVCPAAAIRLADGEVHLEAAACTGCGLCAAACPTQALQVRGVDVEVLANFSSVRCARAGGPDAGVPCLGALAADDLVDLGLRRPGLDLVAGTCQSCALAGGGRQAQAALAVAAGVLAALDVTPPRWIAVAPESADTQPVGPLPASGPREPRVSRREALGLWRRSAVQTGRSLLPQAPVNARQLPARVPRRRRRWLQRVTIPTDGSGTRPSGWPSRAANHRCNGCGICTAFCPTGAMAAVSVGPDWRLTFQPAACVDCGTCLRLCPSRALGVGAPPAATEVVYGAIRELVVMKQAHRPQARGYRPER